MHYGSKGWYVEELKKLGMTPPRPTATDKTEPAQS